METLQPKMTLRPPATAGSTAEGRLEFEMAWLQTKSEFAGMQNLLESIHAILCQASGVAAMRLVKTKLLELWQSKHADAPFKTACDALMEEIAQYGFTDESHRLFIQLYREYRRLWHEARLAHREGH